MLLGFTPADDDGTTSSLIGVAICVAVRTPLPSSSGSADLLVPGQHLHLAGAQHSEAGPSPLSEPASQGRRPTALAPPLFPHPLRPVLPVRTFSTPPTHCLLPYTSFSRLEIS